MLEIPSRDSKSLVSNENMILKKHDVFPPLKRRY